MTSVNVDGLVLSPQLKPLKNEFYYFVYVRVRCFGNALDYGQRHTAKFFSIYSVIVLYSACIVHTDTYMEA